MWLQTARGRCRRAFRRRSSFAARRQPDLIDARASRAIPRRRRMNWPLAAEADATVDISLFGPGRPSLVAETRNQDRTDPGALAPTSAPTACRVLTREQRRCQLNSSPDDSNAPWLRATRHLRKSAIVTRGSRRRLYRSRCSSCATCHPICAATRRSTALQTRHRHGRDSVQPAELAIKFQP